MEDRSSDKSRLTRRHVLKTGATALGAGAGLLTGAPVLDAQATQAPAIVTGTQTGRVLPRPRSPRQHPRRSGDAAAANRPAAGGHPLPGCRALLHDRARRAQHQPGPASGGAEPLRLRRRRGRRPDGEARPGRRPGRRRGHVAMRPVLPVPAGSSGLLPVHVLLERTRGRAVSSVRPVSGRHPCLRTGRHRRHERADDRVRGVLRAGLHRPAGRAAHAARRSVGVGLCRRSRRHALSTWIRRGRLRRRTGRTWSGAGRSRDGRRPGDRDRSDQIPSRIRDEARSHHDARSGGGGRRARRARARAVQGTERPPVRRRRHLGPGRQRRHGARRGLRRRGRGLPGVSAEGRGCSPIPPT